MTGADDSAFSVHLGVEGSGGTSLKRLISNITLRTTGR